MKFSAIFASPFATVSAQLVRREGVEAVLEGWEERWGILSVLLAHWSWLCACAVNPFVPFALFELIIQFMS